MTSWHHGLPGSAIVGLPTTGGEGEGGRLCSQTLARIQEQLLKDPETCSGFLPRAKGHDLDE